MRERERVLLYYMMMVSTKWWFLKNNQNVFVVKEFHIISMRTLRYHSFATFLQMAKHIPQLAHLRAAAVNDVRKPFFLQPLFTFLSSPTSSAVRDYRSVLFERLQNIHVRSAQGFLRSIEWHIDCVWPFLGSAICDWEFPVVCTPVEFIGWFDLKIRVSSVYDCYFLRYVLVLLEEVTHFCVRGNAWFPRFFFVRL